MSLSTITLYIPGRSGIRTIILKGLTRGSRACFKMKCGPAAADSGPAGRDGELRASPKRALSNEPTPATGKRRAARRVFAYMLPFRGFLSRRGIAKAQHPAFCAKTGPLFILNQALKAPPHCYSCPHQNPVSPPAHARRQKPHLPCRYAEASADHRDNR